MDWIMIESFSNPYSALNEKDCGFYQLEINWKAKIPLKIKIFFWYLKNGVVSTKDNLMKGKWKGCTMCCFCNVSESIQHLFFDCPMTKLVWGMVSLTFGIRKPNSDEHLFGPWLRSFSKKQRNLVLVGVAAFCWVI
jgi:hypothetical protein